MQYIEESAKTLETMILARDEWDKRVEREKNEAEALHGLPPSVFHASSGNSEQPSSVHRAPKTSNEPPMMEHLEEYRRKISFLANLLNSPRWALPQNDGVMTKLVRNQRIPYEEQQRELGIIAKVQTHVRDDLRAQLALEPMGEARVSHLAAMNADSTNHTSSDDSAWLSGSDEPISPTKRLLASRRVNERSGSPVSGSAKYSDLEHVFLEASDVSDDGTDAEGSSGGIEVRTPRSRFSESSESVEASSVGVKPKKPVARQLWTSVDSLSSQSSELSRRIARGEDSELGDLNRLLGADLRQQDELTDELVQYAAAMKEAAMYAGNKIRSDAKQLEKMADRMDANSQATKQASNTVSELLNATSGSIWGYLSTMSTVVLVFIIIYIFMKIVPKP